MLLRDSRFEPSSETMGRCLGDLFDGVDGEKLGEAVLVAVVHVAFGSVEQRVEALEQGQLVRQGEHQLWVDDGNGGEDLVEREIELFVGFLIGHDGIGVGFGAVPAVVEIATTGNAPETGLRPPLPAEA